MAALNLSSSVEADIRNAVRSGKEVTAHEDTINFHGRPSAGYMVIDPETGAGGYLIAGGENGGSISSPMDDILSWISIVAEEFLKLLGGVASKAFSSLKGAIDRIRDYLDILRTCDPLTASVAITSISFLTTGLSAILALYAVILPVLLVLIIAVINAILVSKFIGAWKGICERREG